MRLCFDVTLWVGIASLLTELGVMLPAMVA